ncbi:hypothetical protein Droror1_Dr00016716 [Drosera rotundifolia]
MLEELDFVEDRNGEVKKVQLAHLFVEIAKDQTDKKELTFVEDWNGKVTKVHLVHLLMEIEEDRTDKLEVEEYQTEKTLQVLLWMLEDQSFVED